MKKYFSKILYILDTKKQNLALLILIFIVGSFIETLGIASVGPFIALMSRPKIIETNEKIQWIYNYFHFQSSKQFLMTAFFFIVLFFVLQFLSIMIVQYVMTKYVIDFKEKINDRLIKSYLFAPYTLHLRKNTPFLINLFQEIDLFCQNNLSSILQIISNIFVLLNLLIILINTDLVFLIIIATNLLIFFILMQSISVKIRKWGKIQSESKRKSIKIINHSFGGIKETSVIGCENYFIKEMNKEVLNYGNNMLKFKMSQIVPQYLLKTSSIILLLSYITAVTLFFNENSQNTNAAIGVFAVASIRLIPAATMILQSYGKIKNSGYIVDKLYLELKELDKLNLQSKKQLFYSNENTSISFEDVIQLVNLTYSYPNSSNPSLNNISLTFKKNKSIAIIGRSGAGKTTLVDVILGLLEPQEGDLTVDGVSIYNNKRAWQNLLGYIPQSIFLMDDTIEKNIAFGIPDRLIDQEKLAKAIKLAQLEELIKNLDQGLKTQVGERGVRLSGGQRQRIGIARALYHESQVIVMDEATSALDNETEHLITEAIKSLSGEKTLIIIAHRLSTIEHCDHVYMLEKGTVYKSGTYQEVVLGQENVKEYSDLA
jgi:ABC-type multidrug transport system fused ATPase/permease subunit